MNQFPTQIRHWCLMLTTLFTTTLMAQADLEKAFKQLNKGKFESAIPLLNAVENSDPNFPLACFGLSTAYASKDNDARNIDKALVALDSCKAGYGRAKGKIKTTWREDYEFTSANITKIENELKLELMERIKTTNSLAEVDDFLKRYPKSTYTQKKEVGKKHNELFMNTAKTATSYKELSNLINRHLDSLGKVNVTLKNNLPKRCFDAFIKEKTVDSIATFVKQTPKHPYSKSTNAAITEFPKAYKSNALGDWLDYAANHSTSPVAALIVDKIKAEVGANYKQKKGTLTDKQYGNLVYIITGGNAVSPLEDEDEWNTWMAAAKTGKTSFYKVEEMFITAYKARKWDKAKQILADLAPSYTQKSDWFQKWTTFMAPKPEGVVPIELGEEINTSGGEHLPVISGDGQSLFFCGVNRPKDSNIGEDIFMSTKTGDTWAKPVRITSLSGSGNDAPLSISPDGNTILIFVNGKVNESERTASGWSTPKPLPNVINKFQWVCQSQYTPDGRALVFEAYEYDVDDINLYVSTKGNDGMWQEPVKISDVINTPKQDRGPFLHPDGKTMYFSSAGHDAIGGMDVYKTTRLDDTWLKWSKPVNLGYEINTFDSDWGYVVSTDGQKAYFATGKQTSGSNNLFEVPLPQSARPDKVISCEVTVKDADGKPVSAEVVVQELPSGKTHTVAKTDPSTGRAFVTLTVGKLYGYFVKKQGFFPESFNVDLRGATEVYNCKESVTVRPTCSGNVLRNLFFDTGKSELRPESGPELDRVAEIVKTENIKLMIGGHTDNSGNTADNQALSEARAKSVKEALIARGCSSESISSKGFGESKPLERGNSESAMQKNRRVEISCKD